MEPLVARNARLPVRGLGADLLRSLAGRSAPGPLNIGVAARP